MLAEPTTRRRARDRWLTALLVVAFATAGAWLAYREWVRPEPTYRLTATGGRSPGPRQGIARVLADDAARAGLILELSECAGSVQALDAVNAGRVQVALVQGGLDSRLWTEVRLVASLHVEPLQLAVKGDLHPLVAANLAALRGRTISVGEVGSGSKALATEVLRFVGLRDGEYRLGTLGHDQLMAIPEAESLPDAVMTVSSLPTPMIRHLVTRWGYRLVPLPFAEAFALEDLFAEGSTRVGTANDRVAVDKVYIQAATIPAYTYGVEPAVPAAPLATFGSRLLVVAGRKTSADAVKRLLETIFLGKFSRIARPPLDTSLLDLPPEYPLHPGTVDFLQRNKPLIFGDLLELLEKTASFSSVVVGASFLAWQSVKRRYRRKREQSFESYLLKVTAVERRALDHELSSRLDLGGLLALQADLGRIKNEAMRRFTLGELEGEGLMSGFLTHANDARDYLARLILHGRATIEKRARRQGISAEEAWARALAGTEATADGPTEADGGSRPLPKGGPVL